MKAVETGSFSKAGEALYVSAQSVSQQVQKCERELGVRLLERTTYGVVPTAAGQLFYEFCARNKRDLEAVTMSCRKLEDSSKSRPVRLALSCGQTFGIFDRLIPPFLREHPDTEVTYKNPGKIDWLEVLQNGEVDVIEYPALPDASERGLTFEPLLTAKRCCLVLPSSPLARLSVVTPHDLVGQDVCLFCFAWATEFIDTLKQEEPWLVFHEVGAPDSVAMEKRFQSGHAVYLIPEQLTHLYTGLIAVPLTVETYVTYGLLFRQEDSVLLEELLEVARATFA